DNLSRIASLALTSSYSIGEATLKILPPGPHTDLLAQLLAGPQGQTYITVYAFIDIISRLAILVLLFMVGLEISLVEMQRVGKYATYVAVLGIVLPMVLGMGVMRLLHPNNPLAVDLLLVAFSPPPASALQPASCATLAAKPPKKRVLFS